MALRVRNFLELFSNANEHQVYVKFASYILSHFFLTSWFSLALALKAVIP